jgi:hypothetical protein
MVQVQMGNEDGIDILVGGWIDWRIATAENGYPITEERVGQHTHTIDLNENSSMSDVSQT